jgi:hypothetical protein
MDKPIRSDKIEEKPIEWLYIDGIHEIIPKGKISLIAGRPDKGKGLLAVWIAAQVSKTGKRVLYSAAEDDASDMTKPRLTAAGAVHKNIHHWRFRLPADWDGFEQVIRRAKIDLVVIDPLAAHLSNGISRHSDNIRIVTNPLNDLLSETGCSCVVVEHVRKNIPQSGDPLMAIGGTGSGLPAAVRAGYILGVDPQDDDRRVVACVKLNVAEKPDAMAFNLDTVELPKSGVQPFLSWDEDIVGFDPMKLLTKSKGSIGRPPDKRAAAAEWLTRYLVNAGAPVKSSVIFEDAKQYGMTSKTLRRAATDMKIVKSGGGGPNVTWDLPDHVKQLMGIDTTPAPAIGVSSPDGDVDGDKSPDWDQALQDLMDGKDDDDE